MLQDSGVHEPIRKRQIMCKVKEFSKGIWERAGAKR